MDASGRARRGRLRFAVSMRGGVSLAVWIGGGLSEILRLADARRPAPAEARDRSIVERLLALTDFECVEVDVMTGASAGGLNAALASMSAAREAGFDMQRVWLEVADIDALLDHDDPPAPGGRGRRSILNGDYFLREILQHLRTTGSPDVQKPGRRVEAFLATTIFDGRQLTSRYDPGFLDRRSEAFFHFRHLGNDAAFSDFLHPAIDHRLAVAARSTASFPAAFEPVEVRLEDAAGVLQAPFRPLAATGSIRLYDGGIIDNIPLARAIHAVARKPSDSPVRRWMLFLHPSPDLPEPQKPRPVTVPGVVFDFFGAAGSETLLDDLDELQRHNDGVEAYALEAEALTAAALDTLDAQLPDQSAVDAWRIYALLDDPGAAMHWSPMGMPIPDSPLTAMSEVQRAHIRTTLHRGLNEAGVPARPFAFLVRTALTIIDLIRWSERNGAVVATADRQRAYDVLEVAQLLDAALDRRVLQVPVPDVVGTLLHDLRVVRSSPEIVSMVEAVLAVSDVTELRPLIDRLTEHDERAARTLSALADGCLPGGPPASPGGADVADRLLGSLAEVAARVASAEITEPDQPSVQGHLRGALRVRDDAAHLLRHLDAGLAGLHDGKAEGPPQALDYLRISGARRSPLCDPGAFPMLDLVFSEASGLRVRDGNVDPSAKLSGNTFANFAAFFAARFRANDWMWGRLDAAAALVDVVVRGEHLAATTARERTSAVRDVVLPTWRQRDAAPAQLRPIDHLFAQLWKSHRHQVLREMQCSDGPMATSRDLITLRWQLEIMIAQLPHVASAPLQPNDGPSTIAPPVQPAAPPADLDAAARPFRAMLRSYEGLPRNVRSLWGRRQSTALGVRVGRRAVRAVIPGPILSLPVAAPLFIAIAAFVHPATFLVGVNILTCLVAGPRLDTVGHWTLLAVSAVGSFAFFVLLVRRSTGVLGQVLCALVSVALHATLALWLCTVRFVPFDGPGVYRSSSPLTGWRDLALHESVWFAAVLVGGFTFVASLLLWWWARPWWRFLVAVGAAVVMTLAVFWSAWQPTSVGWAKVHFIRNPLLIAALVMFASTALAQWCQPEDRRKRS
jgi:hypothetical protein